jgi:hypothetical protein
LRHLADSYRATTPNQIEDEFVSEEHAAGIKTGRPAALIPELGH